MEQNIKNWLDNQKKKAANILKKTNEEVNNNFKYKKAITFIRSL